MPPPASKRHLRHGLLSTPPSLQHGQKIARVTQTLGENLFEVESDNSDGVAFYKLPKRLRHVAFIKRGSFVFVRDDATRGPSRVKGDIEVVVLDKFLDALRKEAFWPEQFREGHAREKTKALDEGSEEERHVSEEDDEEWEIGMGNPNRRKWDHVSSDEDSE